MKYMDRMSGVDRVTRTLSPVASVTHSWINHSTHRSTNAMNAAAKGKQNWLNAMLFVQIEGRTGR